MLFYNTVYINRYPLFGKIENGTMQLNTYGKIANIDLLKVQGHFPNVHLEYSVVMPNHIHCIFNIDNNIATLQTERSRPFPTIPVIIGLYKSGVAKQIHEYKLNVQIWQKSYYDHIIRNERDYHEIAEYIENNPLKWELDRFYVKQTLVLNL